MVETYAHIVHHKWLLCPHTEPRCVRSSAKQTQNKCPLCLNPGKQAQMFTDIDQGSYFFQWDNGLQLWNRNVGQREVTVSKLIHWESLNLKWARFGQCIKAFGENFTKRNITKCLRWNYSLMWQVAKKTKNHLHKSVSLADKQENVESLLKKQLHQCQQMPSVKQVNYFELIYTFILVFSQYLCLALILMDRQVPCQSWTRGKFLWFEREVWWFWPVWTSVYTLRKHITSHFKVRLGGVTVYNGIW